MAELITKSNTKRKRIKDKRADINELEKQLEKKINTLKCCP